MATLEEIITYHNSRGARDMMQDVPPDACRNAAAYLLKASGRLALLTGFPVRGMPETDGPPGAIALADALTTLGKTIELVSWGAAIDIFNAAAPRGYYRRLENVPAGEPGEVIIITIEICGSIADGTYRNFKGEDISAHAPDFESKFGRFAAVSVGDGGNEFGMGNLPMHFFEKWDVAPPVSRCLFLVPAVTSNFGCYGIVRALECLTARALLPTTESHMDLIKRLVVEGCVDGMSGLQEMKVDGQDLSATDDILSRIRNIDCEAINPSRH